MTYKLNVIPSSVNLKDYEADKLFKAGLSFPNVNDPRKKLLPVRNQGDEGSCVAEASSAMMEIQESKSPINFKDYFSPQFVYNLRINQLSKGMQPVDALRILSTKGIPPEEAYPYGKIESEFQIPEKVFIEAFKYKIKSYAYISEINELKTVIYRNGACIITFTVYNKGASLWKPTDDANDALGGHAMCIVGWTKVGFIIRNSWGADWNNGGYTIFPYEDWGMQQEIWAVITDKISIPEPKYLTLYWRFMKVIDKITKL